MCCLFAVIVFLGARIGGFTWWLFDSTRWRLAFPNFIIPLLGILFLPWTTLMYVGVFPGGVTGWDWFFIFLGLLFDLGSYGGSGIKGKDQIKF